MKWALCALVLLFGPVLFMAPIIAYLSMPWSAWWVGVPAGQVSGPIMSAPGLVPPGSAQPPIGPMLGEDARLMAIIQPWMGSRYLFGGNGPAGRGVDCSGFTAAIYRALGVNLPRTAQTQYNATQRVAKPVVGDLVFFAQTYDAGPTEPITHVGIYVGEGVMISAVEPVLGRQSLAAPFWRSHFAGYGRVRWPAPPGQA